MEKYSLLNLSRGLRRLRQIKNLTQEEAAAGIGVNSRHYQRYETLNMPDIKASKLFKILKFYNVTLEELLGYNFD